MAIELELLAPPREPMSLVDGLAVAVPSGCPSCTYAPGDPTALAEFLEDFRFADSVEVLGPVDLPPGEELPGHDEVEDPERVLLRVPPVMLNDVAAELRALIVRRAGRRSTHPLRVRLDPVNIG